MTTTIDLEGTGDVVEVPQAVQNEGGDAVLAYVKRVQAERARVKAKVGGVAAGVTDVER